MGKRFTKGQKVYYFSTNFADIPLDDRVVEYYAIIERTVDACGAKQMTFEDHGCDGIYGRRQGSQHPHYFATVDEALDHAEEHVGETDRRTWKTRTETIPMFGALLGIYTDRDHAAFDEFERVRNDLTWQGRTACK